MIFARLVENLMIKTMMSDMKILIEQGSICEVHIFILGSHPSI